jgi:RimJ/RimL family protein N-acetyltransferase
MNSVRKGWVMADSTWPPAPLRWPEEPLTDGVVSLDVMRDSDIAEITEGAGDPETARWIPVPVPYTADDAREFLTSVEQEAANGKLLNFAIRHADGERLIGSIGVHFRGKRGEGEIGYWLTPSARGSGLAARAVRLLAAHVMGTYDVHRIELLVDPANVASQKACIAAGATNEGLRRAASPAIRGPGYEIMLVYSLLPGDLA